MLTPREQRDYEMMLHPEELRSMLLSISVFIMVFEMFRERIISHLKTLHSSSIDENGWILDKDEYRADVLARDRNVLRASLMWFAHNEAITVDDLASFDRVRVFRNEVVHSLSDLLGTPKIFEVGINFQGLYALFSKIEIWWIKSFEMEFNSELDGQTLDDDEIVPGSLLAIRMLVDSALGEDEQAWQWYKAFADARQSIRSRCPNKHPED